LIGLELYSGEQILNNGIEERDIMAKELRHVGVPHCTNQHDILRNVRLCSFQCTSHDQDTLDGSHTEIVMVLLRKLLAGKLVKFSHFAGKSFSIGETFGEKHDFSN